MRKLLFLLLVTFLFGILAYTGYAQKSKEFNFIEVPEGTITEIVEVQEGMGQADNTAKPEVNTVVLTETMTVTEGVITIRTEIAKPILQSQTSSTEPADVSILLDELQHTLDSLEKERTLFFSSSN